jgi:hypothetical protein
MLVRVRRDISINQQSQQRASIMGGIQTSGSEVVPFDETGVDDLPEVKLLTSGQRSLLLGYLTTGKLDGAAAGYRYQGAAISAWGSKRMQAAVKAVANAELRGPTIIKAVRTMSELMEAAPGRSDSVRIKAAAWVLEAGGLGAKGEDDGLGKKKLGDMTADELEQFIASQRAVVDGNMKDVTPNK